MFFAPDFTGLRWNAKLPKEKAHAQRAFAPVLCYFHAILYSGAMFGLGWLVRFSIRARGRLQPSAWLPVALTLIFAAIHVLFFGRVFTFRSCHGLRSWP